MMDNHYLLNPAFFYLVSYVMKLYRNLMIHDVRKSNLNYKSAYL